MTWILIAIIIFLLMIIGLLIRAEGYMAEDRAKIERWRSSTMRELKRVTMRLYYYDENDQIQKFKHYQDREDK